LHGLDYYLLFAIFSVLCIRCDDNDDVNNNDDDDNNNNNNNNNVVKEF